GLVRRLPAQVTANSVHPGVIATNLFRGLPSIVQAGMGLVLSSTKEGARPLVNLASTPELEGVTGRYFDKMNEKPASSEGRNEKAAERLWEISEQLASNN